MIINDGLKKIITLDNLINKKENNIMEDTFLIDEDYKIEITNNVNNLVTIMFPNDKNIEDIKKLCLLNVFDYLSSKNKINEDIIEGIINTIYNLLMNRSFKIEREI